MLITHARTATFGSEPRLISDGALLIEGQRIAALGTTADLTTRFPDADRWDAAGQLVLPASICAHTHFYGAFSRGMGIPGQPPENFPQILERLWWRLDKALTLEDVRYSALVCLVDAIRHGTTTLIDHHASPNAIHGSLDVIAEAVQEAGLRASLCYEVTDRDGPERAQAGIEENVRFAKKATQDPHLAASFGLHASLTLSDETLADCLAAATSGDQSLTPPPVDEPSTSPPVDEPSTSPPVDEPSTSPPVDEPSTSPPVGDPSTSPPLGGTEGGPPFHIHVAEGISDQHDSLRRSGKRVVHRLGDAGILGPRTIAVHCVHVDDSEIERLAGTGTWVTHQPRSNMNNAVGVAPVEAMLNKGVNVGLGNDGFSNQMFAEMKAAYFVHKLHQGDPQAMPGNLVMDLAYGNNARLAQIFWPDQRLGELSAGAMADLVFVDYRPTTPLSADNLPWHILFGVEASMITSTVCAGKVLMRDRRLLTLDEEAITARSRELATGVWSRL